MAKYSVIHSDSNPFSDYFKEDNPNYHEKIQQHYIRTVELIVGKNKSVLLTEFRNNKDRQAERVLYYACGYNDCFYHFHLFDFDLDVVAIDIPGFGYKKKYSKSKPYEVERLFNFYNDVPEVCEYMKVAFDYMKSNY